MAATGSSRRLDTSTVKVASTTKQTATLKFTLKDLTTGAKKTAVQTAQVKLDSLLQVLPSHHATLTMQKATGATEASMTYTIYNQGSSKVTPKRVAENLKDNLNSKNPDYVSALAPLGTVKLGTSGCCQLTMKSQTVTDTGTSLTTAAPPAPTPGTTVEVEGAASFATPLHSSSLLRLAALAGMSTLLA
jgi:hypothetical protein